MRVCLVSREVAPFFGAGIGTYIAAMARAWADSGHEVHVLTAGHESVREFLAGAGGEDGAVGEPFAGVRLHVAEEPEGPVPSAGFERYAWTVYRSLLDLHREHRFEYIEFADYGAEGCYAVAGKRVLGALADAVLGVRLHTSTRICRELNGEGWLNPVLAALQCAEESTILQADAVISPTAALLERGGGPPRAGQARGVVPYPFDVSRVDASRVETGAAAKAEVVPLVLYFGRLEKRKGVDLLVEAGVQLLERGEDLVVRLIGGDTQTGPRGASMREHLRGLAPERWAGRFEFIDAQPQEQIAEHVAETKARGGVCCFPSRWENFPNACLEAMALGAAVIGSRRGGMAEIIEDGVSGVLAEPEVGELAVRLRAVLRDAALRKGLQEWARARVEMLCEPGAVVRKMIEIIEGMGRGGGEGAVSTAADLVEIVADGPGAEIFPSLLEGEGWVCIVQPEVDCGDLAQRLGGYTARAARSGCTHFSFLGEVEGAIYTPRLERELLLGVMEVPAVLVVRREALRALAHGNDRESMLARCGELPWEARVWALMCLLAVRGNGTVVPEVLVRQGPRKVPEAMHEAARAQVAHACPELAAGAVPLQLLMWHSVQQRQASATRLAAVQREREAVQKELAEARGLLAEREQRIAALEEQLASLRYKLADRVNEAMKSVGVQGVVKSVASKLGGEEKRP